MKRGFALYMLMIALVLLTAFTLVAGRIVLASMRLTRQAQEAQAREIRFDGMLRVLREDVWGATVAEVSGDGVLKLTRDGRSMSWTRHADGLITRQGEQDRRWEGLGQSLVFERTAEGVVLRVGDDAIVLVSQVMLVKGRTP
jgi:hypothetical protein